jgi:hypothetical protein
MGGGYGKRRQQGQRVKGRHRMAAPESFHRHVEDSQMVRHEEGIKLSTFERFGKALQMAEIEICIRVGAGIAPAARMNGGWPHEGAEEQLFRFSHGSLLGKGKSCRLNFHGIFLRRVYPPTQHVTKMAFQRIVAGQSVVT